MRSYGQFCPVAKAAQVFCERWTALIIRDLGTGAKRFSELRRGVPLMSSSMLSRRLRDLEAEGVVERRQSGSGRGWTYYLTPAGLEFVPIVAALGVWGLLDDRGHFRQSRTGAAREYVLLDPRIGVNPADRVENKNTIRVEEIEAPLEKPRIGIETDMFEHADRDDARYPPGGRCHRPRLPWVM